ncbi:MAG TPA: hypothetical protein VHB25_07940 [Gemmatimonadaceae bacterium]|nr:hypothetical protein [Gemmatimonadaceae bacterium]
MTSFALHERAPLLVVVSIDTEEDNWCPARTAIAVENIRALPALQRRLEAVGVVPTYFTSYQVTQVPWAAEIVAGLRAGGRAEIGAHLHPWNTPPLTEPFEPRFTMMKNLDADLQHAKVATLADAVEEAIGAPATSFRAGRFGMATSGLEALVANGFLVDSSVTPFIDWRRYDDGANFHTAPMHAYRPARDDLLLPSTGPLIELPLSGGYTRRPFARWHRRYQALTEVKVGRYSAASLAHHLRILRKVQLSFETNGVRDMLTLSRRLVAEGARFLHVMWHSPSLVPGLGPFVRTAADRAAFLANIDRFFDRLAGEFPLEFVTVTDAARRLAPWRAEERDHARVG